MTSAFTDVLHVANLTTGSHLMSILTQSDAFSKVFYDNDEVKGLKVQLTSSHTIATQTTNIYFHNLITSSVTQEDHNDHNHNPNHNNHNLITSVPQEDLAKLAKQLQGRKASIGVKKLLGLIDMVGYFSFSFFSPIDMVGQFSFVLPLTWSVSFLFLFFSH